MSQPHPNPSQQHGLIGLFAQHPVAANLLMIMMLLSGVWALAKLNTQFFPNFELDFITVRVIWSGATAEDVEEAITDPLEQELRILDGLKNLTSTSTDGIASITLEYHEGTNMGIALDDVKERVALVRNLPSDAEDPEVSRVIRYDPIARVLVTGADADLRELRTLARRFEDELLERGIAKVELEGLPEEEVAIQVPSRTLQELGMSLAEIADQVARESRDIPAGTVGREDVSRQLRSLDQRRDELGFETLPIKADQAGQLLRLGDIAEVERRERQKQVAIYYQGQPAVELRTQRAESADALDSAKILRDWLEETRPTLPEGIELKVYDESWELIEQRIMLLVKNGGGGLLLVLLILFLFLNARVAFWVAVGIPTSFAATLFILYLVGGSINMISLFALIMALGIIVDDAIVVGEDALTHYQRGDESALVAAEGGALRMLAPVTASSLTTIAAFMPLMLVGGVIGNIMFDLPLVVICVIIASLIESFLVLPGHLRKSFLHMHGKDEKSPIRDRLDRGFAQFRDQLFRPLARGAVANPFLTLALAVASLILAVGLLAGGRLAFNFFPTPEGSILEVNVSYAAGTPPDRARAFLDHLGETLQQTEAEFGEELVVAAIARQGQSLVPGGRSVNGDQYGSMLVELVDSDARSVRNNELIRAWRSRVEQQPGIENFSISARRAGPPGRDVEVRLIGSDAAQLKAAAQEVTQTLEGYSGVSAIADDMAYGSEQLVYTLTPQGKALGLSVEAVGRQLRAAYDGALAQIFQDGADEVEVRVVLPDAERYRLGSLESLPIVLPNGNAVPLLNVIELTPRRGFETLRHAQGKLAVQVTGDIDTNVTKIDEVLSLLERDLLADLVTRYGIEYSFEGRAAEQRETLGDMQRGLIFALILIYLVLAWVFASYGWPGIVMSVIPFAAVGSFFGHWLLGIDLTILSLFGLFGLSGIVVNDSIILVTFYKQLRESGMATQEAIVEAACQRLRAVLLTSLTTIAGLTPLLFETSLQAQFLIPMAVSISFGLGVATFLVLFVVPAQLAIYESIFGRHRLPAPVEELA